VIASLPHSLRLGSLLTLEGCYGSAAMRGLMRKLPLTLPWAPRWRHVEHKRVGGTGTGQRRTGAGPFAHLACVPGREARESEGLPAGRLRTARQSRRYLRRAPRESSGAPRTDRCRSDCPRGHRNFAWL